MKVSELQNIFIEELKILLPGWKFIKSRRHFKKIEDDVVWYFHIDCINHLEDFDAVGNTPLHYAIENEHYKVAEFLLESGANINAYKEEKIGETPLGHVAANCTYEMAEFLIKNGANPTIPGWMQLTALDRAKQRKKEEEGRYVYNLLLKTAIKKYNYKA